MPSSNHGSGAGRSGPAWRAYYDRRGVSRTRDRSAEMAKKARKKKARKKSAANHGKRPNS
nr:hypothetical protein Ade03nite_80400 [Actinoplanes derwentensis]